MFAKNVNHQKYYKEMYVKMLVTLNSLITLENANLAELTVMYVLIVITVLFAKLEIQTLGT